VPDEVPAFRWRTQRQRDRDEFDDVVERARPRGTQEGFQLRKRKFDRIQVGAVRRQELEPRAPLFHGRTDLRLFVGRQVVEHDHVPGLERGREDLLDVGEERRIVDRPIKHGRGIEPAEAQAHDNGVRLPMTARCVIAQPGPARAAPIPAQQIGRDAALIQKDVLAHVPQGLHPRPLPARSGDIRPALFVGVYRFF